MAAGLSGRMVIVAGALALGGCATADLRPGIVRHETPKQIWQKFHGPDVSIKALVVSTHNSRLIQPTLYVDDSAYVVVGDIGDDGTLRIVYPTRPGESYRVQKGGRFDAPRFQPRIVLPFMATAFSVPRTASGYAFVIASSQPLQLEKLMEGERWSVFDVYYDNHQNDPRPAIADLAAAISPDVGTISIAYAGYSWGLIGTRAGVAQRAAPEEYRRRLPRRPP